MAVCLGITYNSVDNNCFIEYTSGDVHGDSFDNFYNYQDIIDTAVDESWLKQPSRRGSQFVENTKTVYEPLKLVVEKSGYQTLEIPNIYCTIDGIGTLSPTVVEGKMVLVEVTGENLQHFITEDVLEHVITEDKLTHEITD